MGATKKHIHNKEIIEMANLFKAMGHPARVAIVNNLLADEEANCKKLQDSIQLSQSTISSHLKILHEVGILDVKVEGNNAFYRVNKPVLSKVSTYLENVFHLIESKTLGKLGLHYNPVHSLFSQNFTNNS